MSTAVSTTSSSFTPAVQRSSSPRAAAITECVTAILEGRPLPEAWRMPPAPPTRAPRTVEEGITRILAGQPPCTTEG